MESFYSVIIHRMERKESFMNANRTTQQPSSSRRDFLKQVAVGALSAKRMLVGAAGW